MPKIDEFSVVHLCYKKVSYFLLVPAVPDSDAVTQRHDVKASQADYRYAFWRCFDVVKRGSLQSGHLRDRCDRNFRLEIVNTFLLRVQGSSSRTRRVTSL